MMWCSAVIVCCSLVLLPAQAGLLGGSLLPQASLDVFKSSSTAPKNPQTTPTTGGSSQKNTPGSKPACKGTTSLLNVNCVTGSNLVQQTSDTLDTLNINGKVDVPLTPLEAEGMVSLNPSKINANANLNNKNEASNVAAPENPHNGPNIPNRINPAGTSTPEPCLETVTLVNGEPSCKGKLVFEENFNILNNSNWQHVVQFASAPDYEFVVYSNDKKNSYVSNGKLYIKPTLLSDDGIDIATATLELDGCTSSRGGPECKKTAIGRDILPPVKSARIRTKESFSFQYGHVEVQAKLPAGDWIFPEIWLEPKKNIYGSNRYESGLIQLALIRSNLNLIVDGKEIGARQLSSRCIQGIGKIVHSETFSIDNVGLWTNEFHTYAMTWTPDNITFTVDGKKIGTVTPPQEGFKTLGPFSDLQVPWARGNKMAPYDQEFFISVGIGAGGFREFPDNSVSNGHNKPWKNLNIKAMLSFWQDKDSWFPSWFGDSSSLQVEHIKVWAL